MLEQQVLQFSGWCRSRPSISRTSTVLNLLEQNRPWTEVCRRYSDHSWICPPCRSVNISRITSYHAGLSLLRNRVHCFFLRVAWKKKCVFSNGKCTTIHPLYRFPHIRYGNGRINKRTISAVARGNVYFCKSCNDIFKHKRKRGEKSLSFKDAVNWKDFIASVVYKKYEYGALVENYDKESQVHYYSVLFCVWYLNSLIYFLDFSII